MNETEINTRRREDQSLLSVQQEGMRTRTQEGISLGKN